MTARSPRTSRVALNVQIPAPLKNRVDAFAVAHGISQAAAVAVLLTEAFDARDRLDPEEAFRRKAS
jgi:hypothetical protein